MKKLLLVIMPLFTALCTSTAFGDSLVGEYTGTIKGLNTYPYKMDFSMNAQISQNGNGTYKIRFVQELFKGCENFLLLDGIKAKDSEILFDNYSNAKINGTITPKAVDLTLVRNSCNVTIKLEKFTRVSPTLGEKAPANAMVLFNSKDLSQWLNKSDKSECKWSIEGDHMIVKSEKPKNGKRKVFDTISKKSFKNFKMHLEFCTVDKFPDGTYSSGNSGVYIGPYEIQVLNSFNGDGTWMECGALYRTCAPKTNAALPPNSWQTYDLEFTNAVFEGDKLVEYPKVTLWHNGIKVLSDEKALYATAIRQGERASFKHPKGSLPIILQDHGDPVMYRNIWIVEK